MTVYDRSFSPPAPLALVTLRHPTTNVSISGVSLQIDTGADVTLLPDNSVRQLGVLEESGLYELQGFGESLVFAPAFRLHLIFLGRSFKGKYAVIEGSEGVLGRDVLNRLALVFDGPALSWGEAQK